MPDPFSLRRILVCLAAVATLFVVAQRLLANTPTAGMALNSVDVGGTGGTAAYHRGRIAYTAITGVFLQSQASTVADGFDYAATNFGLIDRAYPGDVGGGGGRTQWQRFAQYVDTLNEEALKRDVFTRYKVLFMGRHGEGDHNVAEALYGTPAWNCYWAQRDGNGTVVWADAHLTEIGKAEATKANRFWADQLAAEKQPAPQRYYVSPLTRCLQTAAITFGGLELPSPFVPTIKEFLREDVSTHTCDRRSSRAAIHKAFPAFVFEDGFAENDPLWTGTTDETPAANDVRSRALLDDVFRHDDSTWLSLTSHSGEITSLLRVLGHRAFPLSTGQIIPVLVRAETLHDDDDTRPSATNTAWAKASNCAAPPVTSVQDQGCVCSPTGTANAFKS